MRFSTVAGGRDSSEATRDPRGFAVKFYTEDGNWDLVGNNLGVFFIRDAIKFPDFIHSQKPDPVSFERQVPNRVFDFISQSPESMHMVTLVFGPRGIPASYRTMQGFGVNTYKWVNEAGETKLVKYHWLPKQGVKSWTEADAGVMQGRELGCHTKELYEAIERGEYPEWELNVQMMDDHDHPELDWDPLDDTKTWPEQDFPLTPIGTMVLNRTTKNVFAENEQIAFGTGVLVDGLDFSDDKMLVGRTFSYSDTQRYRVGPNYLQLPVNQPKNGPPATNQRDSQMAYYVDQTGENPSVNYEPSITGGLGEAPKPAHAEVGPEITGASPARASRARTTTARRASATSSPSSGRRTTSSATSPRCWASATGRSRSAWSGTCSCATTSSASASATASASPPTTCARSSRSRRRAGARRSSSASTTSATTARATSRASS